MAALRNIFGEELVKIGRKNNKVVVVSCDLKGACKTDLFFKNYPKRSFEVGIAEANAIGISAGLALSGFRPVLASFGSFLTGKNIEIRCSISYNKAPVILVGTHGGLIGADGATQSALQDISVMRSIPGIDIFQPSAPREVGQILNYVIKSKNPSYIRLARNEIKEFLPIKYKFKAGYPKIILKGTNGIVISSGPLLKNCYDAIKKSDKKIALLNLSTIKPLNKNYLNKLLKSYNKIITVEDHTIEGGLGSTIAEMLAQQINKKIKMIGVTNQFIDSDEPDILEKKYKLDTLSLKSNFENFFK